MKSHRPHLFLALLALTACSGDSGTEMPSIASITLSPPSPTIDVGLTVQFSAQALNASGGAVSDATIVWATSDPTVASITTGGLATGLTTGTTAITASAGSASASQVLIVQPSNCVGRVDVVLAPGAFQSYSGDTCLFLPSGASGDRYRVAIARPTLIEDPADVPLVTLEINAVLVAEQAGSAQPAAMPVPDPPSYTGRPSLGEGTLGIDVTRITDDLVIRQRTRRFHTRLRLREMELGLTAESIRPSRPPLASGPALVDPPTRRELFLNLELLCDQTVRSPVVRVAFNDDLVIYQDSVERLTEPLSGPATTRMLDYYSNYVRDMILQYWGDTPDTDGNGRVILTTSPSLADSAAAAVFSGDFATPADCAGSNEGEVMYFDAGTITAMDEASPSFSALSIMAHEVKHVTSLYHSVRRGAGREFHPLWIEEGTAEISQTMSARIAWEATGGPALGTRLTETIIRSGLDADNNITPEMWGLVVPLVDVIVQLSSQPNSLITNPTGAGQFHSFVSGGWQWHRFLGDAYGNASTPLGDAPMFKELTDSLTPAGSAAHTQVTGRTFQQLFEEFVVAISLHGGLQAEPARAYTTWDLFSVTQLFANPANLAEIRPPHNYPWPVTATLAGSPNAPFATAVYSCPLQIVNNQYELPAANSRCAIGPSGIRFHDFLSSGGAGGAQIRVTGADSGRIIVTRLR